MRLWGTVSLIFGPLILVAAVDIVSFVCPFRSHPKTAPAWGIRSERGELAFVRLGEPQIPAAFIASPSYRKLDEIGQAGVKNGWYLRYRDPNDRSPRLVLPWDGDGFFFVGNYVGPCSEIVFSYWPLFFLLGCLPPIAALGYVIAHADRYRRPKGLCQRCSYDLRGNSTGICPECGTKWK